MQLGAVRHKFDSRSQAALQPFAHTLIVRDTGFQPGPLVDSVGIQELYATLARDHRRNTLIVNDVVAALREGRSPIVLTERREHLEHFLERLRNAAQHLIVLHGGLRSRERRETFARFALIPDGEERLLIATGRYIGEGFDDPRLDTLFLALPVSWKGTLIQYAGRLHRIHPRKAEVRIYDYVDRAVPMLMKMFQRRLRGYRAIGYARHDAPLGLHPMDSEPVLEQGKDTTTYLHEES